MTITVLNNIFLNAIYLVLKELQNMIILRITYYIYVSHILWVYLLLRKFKIKDLKRQSLF